MITRDKEYAREAYMQQRQSQLTYTGCPYVSGNTVLIKVVLKPYMP